MKRAVTDIVGFKRPFKAESRACYIDIVDEIGKQLTFVSRWRDQALSRSVAIANFLNDDEAAVDELKVQFVTADLRPPFSVLLHRVYAEIVDRDGVSVAYMGMDVSDACNARKLASLLTAAVAQHVN